MTQLDARELEIGVPSSLGVLINHQSPVLTRGFRGYFAGDSLFPMKSFTDTHTSLPCRGMKNEKKNGDSGESNPGPRRRH
eukprot:5946330-Pleurochrysis_carterae.AAC.1